MILEPRPYLVAEVCYNPEWPETPWYIIRSGTVAEQGGLCFGSETASFGTLEDALEYLREMISRDEDTIKAQIDRIKNDLPQ